MHLLYYSLHPCKAFSAARQKVDRRYAIKKQFLDRMGYPLDLNHPTSLNEKMQWLKLYDRNPLYTEMADKYEMKKIVREYFGDDAVLPTIALYDRVSSINWSNLPESFVIKCTHDSGSAIFCNDKKDFDFGGASQKLEQSFKRNFYYQSLEWSYKHIKPRIIVEPLLRNSDGSEIVDYKFYCYGGKLRYWMYSVGEAHHRGANLKFDPNCNCIDHFFKESPTFPLKDVIIPRNIDDMIKMADSFGKAFPHIRIDMFNVNEHIYVGEFTFYSNGGYINICNSEYSQYLSDCIDLSKIRKITGIL